MLGKIGKNGALYVCRKNTDIVQFCPFNSSMDGQVCGHSCPAFIEQYDSIVLTCFPGLPKLQILEDNRTSENIAIECQSVFKNGNPAL